MADNSKIQWTEATWNPWHGCKKVSPGCKYCYMYRDKDRYGQDPTTVLKSKTKFAAPLNWDEGRLIFTCSWSDWFVEEADEWRDEAWDIIKATPQHTYQILTKRPDRIIETLPDDWGEGYDNVWLGVSGEDEEHAYERGVRLANVPAKMRFMSAEPLIGYIHTNRVMDLLNQEFDWVILGGESGNEKGKYTYRPCKIDWMMEVVYRAKIPVFVKQLGSHLAKEFNLNDRFGGDITEWPEWLQVRQFPKGFNHK